MKKIHYVLVSLILLTLSTAATAQGVKKFTDYSSGAPLQKEDQTLFARPEGIAGCDTPTNVGCSVRGTLEDVHEAIADRETTVIPSDDTGTTDVTSEIDAFMEANGGQANLPCGRFLVKNLNPATENFKLKGSGDCTTLVYDRETQAIAYSPPTDIYSTIQTVLSVDPGLATNDSSDFLTKVKVADASGFSVGGWAHLTSQASIPEGATPQRITGITNANPGVVTYNGSDTFANGDVVTLYGIMGMTELNNRSFKVASVNTGSNTFSLTTLADANVNTTNYGAFSNGGVWFETGATWRRVVSVTNANPPAVTLASAGPSEGDTIVCRYAVGMDELNYRAFKAVGVSGATFNLDNMDGSNPDSTNWGKYQASSAQCTEGGGIITNITAATPPVVTTNVIGSGTNTTGLANADTIEISLTNGTHSLNRRSFRVANLNTTTGTFELQDRNSVNITGTSIGTYISTAFLSEGKRWVGEQIQIVGVDTDNDEVWLRTRPSMMEYFKPDNSTKIGMFAKTRTGYVKNLRVEAKTDPANNAISYRPHAIDISGIPDFKFSNLSGGELYAGLSICRSCPGQQFHDLSMEKNPNQSTGDPRNGDGSAASASLTGITVATEAVLTYSGSDVFSNGMFLQLRLLTNWRNTFVEGKNFIVSDVNTAANTMKLRYLDTKAYLNTSSLTPAETGGTIYYQANSSSGQINISSVDTSTDTFTVASISSSVFGDGDPVYLHNCSGDYAALHNTVWYIDYVSSTTFKLYSTNGAALANYYNATGTYPGDCWISLANVSRLSYLHSIYNSGDATGWDLFTDGNRHAATTDTKSDSNTTLSDTERYEYGITTRASIFNLTSRGGMGPVAEGHEDDAESYYSNIQVFDMLKGAFAGSYEGIVGQCRGLDCYYSNIYAQNFKIGIRTTAFNHHRPSNAYVDSVTLRNGRDTGGQDIGLLATDVSGLFFKPVMVLRGINTIDGVSKSVVLDNASAIIGTGATLNVYNPGARVIDFSDGDSAYFEIGTLNVDFSGGKAPSTTKLLVNASTRGNTFKVNNKLNIVMGDDSSSPSSTQLIDVANTPPFLVLDINDINITAKPGMTIPPLVEVNDYDFVEWANYGPDSIILGTGEEATTLTTGTSKYCRVITRNFMPTNWVANVSVVDSTQVLTFDVNKNGTSVFGTAKITIDANEKTSLTAAARFDEAAGTVAVLRPGDELCYDIDTLTPVGAKGAKIIVQGYAL